MLNVIKDQLVLICKERRMSFLHLVCLLAMEIPVSEALWGQLSHFYFLFADHHVCPQHLLTRTVAVCGCILRCLCSFLGNGAFARVRVVSLKTSGGVLDGRTWCHIFVPSLEKVLPKVEIKDF